MRFVIYGAGGIGGVTAARLAQAGHDVAIIARGAHLDVVRRDGLRVETADGIDTVALDAYADPEEAAEVLGAADAVLLSMKSNGTVAALDALLRVPGVDSLPIVCLQNGVSNEREALRRFPHVYGVCVISPVIFLEPGLVSAFSSPINGIYDLGRYPEGVDATAEELAAAFSAATFASQARPDIMSWKYNKLLMNLPNGVEALCGPDARFGALGKRLRAEGVAVLDAAGIAVTPSEEEHERRKALSYRPPARFESRPGGSTWQSLQRGTGEAETDHLNGEIVLLGRLHGVPTPANALVQTMTRDAARAGEVPGAHTEEELLALLDG